MSNSRKIQKIAMLSIHSSLIGELGTRDTGGMSVYLQELAKELSNLGVLVDVFTLSQNQSSTPKIPMLKNVRLIFLNVNAKKPVFKENLPDYLPAVFDAFNEKMEKENLAYNLIHSHYWLSGMLGSFIKQLHNVAHVMTFHTLGAVKNQACIQECESHFRIAQEKKLVAACDRIVSSTKNEIRELISLYNAAEDKISVVPAGVNQGLFRPLNKADARKKLGINDKAYLLLYVGRNVPVKGLNRLLRIMPEINKKAQFRLLVVGGDDENKKTETLIRELNIYKDVVLIGRKDQRILPEYYSAADMLVVPSYHESFCLAGLESLACGTPVVSAPVGVMPEVINHGNGCILTKNDGREMAKAIIRLAERKWLAQNNAKQIRASVKRYSWANTANLMLGEYEKALKQMETINGKGLSI